MAFTEFTYARYRTARHHRIIAEELQSVERGEVDRLMLLVAPRHGKSELASRRFPAWFLGRQPDKQFISGSASAEFASDFGREVRNLMQSQEYRALFSTKLAQDSQAKNKWHTTAGGVYYAVGIGGQIMGRGADVMLIDDPFATMADAQSEVSRKAVWEWFTGSAYNRLQPGGAIIIINHRMHEDDLCGRLLAQQAAGGDQWHVVEMPAVAEGDDPLGREVGGALWPEQYPIEDLERIRANTIPRFWSALYQQRPSPETGDYFKSDWLKPYIKGQQPVRETMQVYGGSDYAVTEGGGDYTAHVVVGVDPDNKIWLLDLWREQASSDRWVDSWCDLVKEWKPIGWAEETGQIKGGVGPFLDQRARERKAYCARQQFPTRTGNKEIRAQSIRGRMALDGLYVPTYEPWYADFRSELMNFPAGKHDDCVDALGLIGQLLDTVIAGRVPKKPEPEVETGYRSMTRDDRADSVLTL